MQSQQVETGASAMLPVTGGLEGAVMDTHWLDEDWDDLPGEPTVVESRFVEPLAPEPTNYSIFLDLGFYSAPDSQGTETPGTWQLDPVVHDEDTVPDAQVPQPSWDPAPIEKTALCNRGIRLPLLVGVLLGVTLGSSILTLAL